MLYFHKFTRFQDEKETQLNNIDVVIMLPEDKFRTIKSTEIKNKFDDCVLVNKSNMSKMNEQINEYEAEIINEHKRQK